MAQNNLVAALAYLFGWVSGLIVFFISKEDGFARFHGMQSILLNIAMFLLYIVGIVVIFVISMVLGIITAVLNLGAISGILFIVPWGILVLFMLLLLLVWLWTMVQAFMGNWFKLPIIGNMAENWSR